MRSEPNPGGVATPASVAVIALDRWGRVLLLREREAWRLPGGPVEKGESADAASLRTFEGEAGHLLEELRLFGIFLDDSAPGGQGPSELHVYYCDPDLDVEVVGVDPEQEFRYLGSDERPTIGLTGAIREIIEQFFQSTHYRAMFH